MLRSQRTGIITFTASLRYREDDRLCTCYYINDYELKVEPVNGSDEERFALGGTNFVINVFLEDESFELYVDGTKIVEKEDVSKLKNFQIKDEQLATSLSAERSAMESLVEIFRKVTIRVANVVYGIYNMPSVKAYTASVKEKFLRLSSAKIKTIKAPLSFDELVELMEKFNVYDTRSEAMAGSNYNYDVMVEIVVDSRGTESPYVLALSKEEYEEFEKFVTETQQRRMASKLSKSASRLT